jgi:hypothetical protein
MVAIPLDDSGAQLLLPTQSLKGRFHWALAMLGAVTVAAVPALAHWMFVAGQLPVAGPAWGMYAAAGAGLVAFGILTLRRWGVSRRLSDARLRVRPAPMVRGRPFELELEVDAYGPLRVKEARARVMCTEHYKEKRGNKTQYGSRARAEEKVTLAGPAEVPAGQVFAGKGTVVVNEAAAPPTSRNTKEYPHYTWKVRVEIVLEGAVDYVGEFPVEVA